MVFAFGLDDERFVEQSGDILAAPFARLLVFSELVLEPSRYVGAD